MANLADFFSSVWHLAGIILVLCLSLALGGPVIAAIFITFAKWVEDRNTRLRRIIWFTTGIFALLAVFGLGAWRNSISARQELAETIKFAAACSLASNEVRYVPDAYDGHPGVACVPR
jgi:hypothetical protein